MRVVSPYSLRLDCGDHTSRAPASLASPNSARVIAVPWMITVADVSAPSSTRCANSCCDRSLSRMPSARCR